jgi:ribose transport system substrate-binding protein
MLMRNNSVRVIALLCLVVVLVYGYSRFFPKKTLEVMPKIILVTKTSDPNVEFWQQLSAGARVAAKEFGVEIEIEGPRSDSDVEGQISILDRIVKYGPLPQVLMMVPTDFNKMVPIAREIKDAGISLVTIESSLNGDLSNGFIGTDNLAAGKKVAQAAAQVMPVTSQIAIINFVKGSSTSADREEGVRQELVQHPGIKIMDTYFCDGVEENAYKYTKELLSSKNIIDGIVALNETATQGAARAVKEMGMSGKVKLIGFDSSIQEINGLEEGVIQSLIVQKPFNMGYLGVKTSVQLLKKIKITPKFDTGSEIITKDNMYTYENQKLLFPFVER